MRLKGISWIEQHFEKVFAGVFAVGALGVLTMQFAGKPNVVKVGNKGDIALELAYDEVKAAAIRTRDEVTTSNIEVPKLPEGSNPIANFEKAYRGQVAPGPQLAFAVGAPAGVPSTMIGNLGDRAGAQLAKVQIPAPAQPVSWADMYTIAPSWHDVDEVRSILPAAAPFDIPSITVETTFDTKALKAAFEADPDGAAGPIVPMRRDWWESMQILAFALEREELLPDGKWGKSAVVPAMPGRDLLLAHLDKVADAGTLNEFRAEATERADEIRRPEFYDLWYGLPWASPSEHLAEAEANKTGGNTRDAKLAEKKQLERRLETVQRQRDAMGPMAGGAQGDAPAQGREPRGGGGGGAGKRGGAGGGAGRGRQPSGGGQPARTYTDGERKAADRNIENLEKRIAQIDSDLGLTKADPSAARPTSVPLPDASIFEQAEIRLWAHDLAVERGKTYRYRGTVVFNNPLFGRGTVMLADQAEWARPTLARSEPSPWSDAVQAPPESYWFITSASEPGGQFGRSADARAEFFVFTMGFWRQAGVSLEPGDRIATDVVIPDASKVPIAASNQPADRVPDAGTGGKRGPAPAGGKGGAAAPSGPASAPKPDAEQPEKIPTISKAYAVDATLLGVGSVALNSAESSAGGARLVQAYFRMADGTVQTRRPDIDRGREDYGKVRKSSEAAKTADRPAEPERERPPTSAPGRDVPPPPPPGGGAPGSGGGGG